jgi:hypothetical protein
VKLTDIQNEQALDVLADIIEPTAEILADEEVQRIYKSEPKLKLATYIIRNYKKNIIEIMARLDGADPAEYKFNLLTLPKKLLELLNDPDLADLFTLQAMNDE